MAEEEQPAASRMDVQVVRWKNRERTDGLDTVSVEEPLEIFVDDEPFYVTMRSPGEELLLAVGLCFSEGVIDSIDDTEGVNYCKDIFTNRVNIYLGPRRKEALPLKVRQKRGTTFSSCGICGKDLVEEIAGATLKVERRTTISFSRLLGLQQVLQANQRVHHMTGGSHAAAIFDAEGRTLALSEDVGRHNALDKAIGKILFSGKTGEATVAVLSSRLSYEMVQKTARLGIEILAGASAPTSLGVELARATDVTLIGFLRGSRGNVYSCPERIIFE